MALLERLQTGLNAIYPARCLSCGDVVEGDFGFCGPCWRDTAFVGGAICDCCGVSLPGSNTFETLRCDSCLDNPRPWCKGRAAFLYRDTGRKLVLALKHGDRQEIAHPAGRWMAQAARDILEETTLIAPVPLHWRRMLQRRYNQSALLAKSLSRHTGAGWCPDLLQRYRSTPSLDGLNRAERVKTVKDSIRVNPRRKELLQARPILLVDDVMTTGATLAACTRACLAAGSRSVCVVTLARAAKDT